MENEIDNVLRNARHSLALFEGPLASELENCCDISPDTTEPKSPVHDKIMEATTLLERLTQILAPPNVAIADAIFGYVNSKVLLCAAEYKLADHVQKLQPCDLAELAQAAGVHELELSRLMHYLQTMGYFSQDNATRKFSNNRQSSFLRQDHWAGWVKWLGCYTRAPYPMLLSYLPDQMRADQPNTAYELCHGDTSFYASMADSEQAAEFHDAIGVASIAEAPGLMTDYPWHEVGSEPVLDVGAGGGDFIRTYLQQFPDARAAAFELPPTAELLRTKFPADDPLSSRLVSITGGDFFKDEIPRSSVYVLRWVLHNWPDTEGVTLLRRIREAITLKGGLSRVILLETVMDLGPRGKAARYVDMIMLTMYRSKERTLDEYRSLAEAAGWRVERVIAPRGCVTHMIELRPK